MLPLHEMTNIVSKWRVEFKQRGFSRDFDSEDAAKAVIAADKDLFEAEKVVLHSTLVIMTRVSESCLPSYAVTMRC